MGGNLQLFSPAPKAVGVLKGRESASASWFLAMSLTENTTLRTDATPSHFDILRKRMLFFEAYRDRAVVSQEGLKLHVRSTDLECTAECEAAHYRNCICNRWDTCNL